MIQRLLNDEASTLEFAGQLAKVIDAGAIIFLNGPLGAGKTTFTRGFLRGLGYTDKVKSPTYTLVEPYDINGRMIYHFDCYRLQDSKELEYIGIRDYFSPDAICIIEWPEKGAKVLPEPDLICDLAITASGDSRELRLASASARGELILKHLEAAD